MAAERYREVWLRVLALHARSARSHEVAATLFEQMGDIERAALASEFGAVQRRAYSRLLARHPEWASDVDDTPRPRPRAQAPA